MAKEITAGDLQQLIRFRIPIESKNNEGGRELDYGPESPIEPTYACIRQVDQKRAMEAGIDAMIDAVEVLVRNEGVNGSAGKDWLIEHGDDKYLIASGPEKRGPLNMFVRYIAKRKTDG